MFTAPDNIPKKEPPHLSSQSLHDIQFTQSDVFAILTSLDIIKACGFDNFNPKIFRYCASSLLQIICHLFSTSILSSTTVEPLNNGHFGTSNFWHNFTVIERLSSFRGKIVLPWSYRDHKICERGQMYCILYSECPLREVPLYTYRLAHSLYCSCLQIR